MPAPEHPHHGHAHGHDHDHDHHHDDPPAAKAKPAAAPHDHSQHGHGHHGHGHAHGPSTGTAFAIGLALNLAFVVVEAVCGVAYGSMALLADAGHNLSDVLGLALALGTMHLARRPPSGRRTYGYKKATVLSALANAVVLLAATGAIAWEAIQRLGSPTVPDGLVVMGVAGIGVLVNGTSALLLAAGSKHDLNVRAAFLHLAADAAVSLGVVLAGLTILRTGVTWIDPVSSLVVCVVIVASTWSLLRQSTDLALDAVPAGVDLEAVRGFLAERPGVAAVHDLHIWALSTTEAALTAHLVVAGGADDPGLAQRIGGELQARFGIQHATLQIEPAGAAAGVCLGC